MRILQYFWRELRIPIILLMVTLIGGSLGYKILFPDLPWLKVIYATAITLTTVGYGDILGVGNNAMAQLYTIVLIFLGMGMVLYSASSITAFIIEGKVGKMFKNENLIKRISAMNNHFVVCGVGETGHHVLEEITKSNKPLVVIDFDEDKCERLKEEFPEAAILCGDATHDEILEQANLKNAKALIATLSHDKDNLVLVFTTKMLNSQITVVSKSESIQMVKKLNSAGANYVVSPQFIGGMRMASVAMRPSVVSFLDRMLKGSQKNIRVNEFVIPESSSLVGLTFRDAPIKEKTGLNIFAYAPLDKSEDFQYNPSPDTTIQAGGVLLFICEPQQQDLLEKTFS